MWVPGQDLAMPHSMRNCGKRILSLHCTLYIRLCTHVLYAGDHVSSRPVLVIWVHMIRNNPGKAWLCLGLQAPMPISWVRNMCPCSLHHKQPLVNYQLAVFQPAHGMYHKLCQVYSKLVFVICKFTVYMYKLTLHMISFALQASPHKARVHRQCYQTETETNGTVCTFCIIQLLFDLC